MRSGRRPDPTPPFFAMATRRRLRCLLLVLAVGTASTAAWAQEQAVYPPCREVRSLDAMQYWFWDAYFGHVDVHDFTHERWGRLAVEPTICFRIALVVIDNPQLRTAGYRQAVTELLQWAGGDDNEDDNRRIFEQLERITGEDFDSRAEWADWWTESEPFVTWSSEEEHLVVVEEALAAGEVVHEDALLLEPEEYWFYEGRGWISQGDTVGDSVFGSVLIPPHDFNFRIATDDLQDRGAKERGYRRALDNLFVDGLLLPDLGAPQTARIIERLGELTGATHADRAAWVTWWNQNRQRLVLSPAGDRLVVRS